MKFRRIKSSERGAAPRLAQARAKSRLTDDSRLLATDSRLASSSWRLADEVAERGRVERLDNSVAHLKPHRAGLTADYQGASLFRGVLRDTLHRSDRAFHDSIDFADPDFVGVPGQLIAAMCATGALHE